MFGSKKKKVKKKEGKSPIKFDIETMESDLKNPYQKKEYDFFSESGEGNKKSAGLQASPPQKNKIPPRENQPNSPFLTDEITPVPSSTYDPSQSDLPKEKVLSSSPNNNHPPLPGPSIQTKKEPEQIPKDLPVSGTVQAPQKVRSQTPSPPSENIFHKDKPLLRGEVALVTSTKKEMGKKKPVQQKKGLSMPLLIIAIVILIATLSAGAYYYFFVLNESEAETSEVNPTPPEPIADDNQNDQQQDDFITPPDDPIEVEVEEFNAEEFIVQDDLLLELKNYLNIIKTDTEKTALLSNGFLLKPMKKGEALSASQVLEGMHISIENLDLYTGEKAWIFLSTEPRNDSIVKVSLLLSMDKTVIKEDVHSSLLAKEKTFPVSMKALYVNELPPTDPALETIVFSISTIDSSVRFFNYQENDPSQSIDWGIVVHKGNNYLITTTSKESTKKLLKFLDI